MAYITNRLFILGFYKQYQNPPLLSSIDIQNYWNEPYWQWVRYSHNHKYRYLCASIPRISHHIVNILMSLISLGYILALYTPSLAHTGRTHFLPTISLISETSGGILCELCSSTRILENLYSLHSSEVCTDMPQNNGRCCCSGVHFVFFIAVYTLFCCQLSYFVLLCCIY